VLGTLLLVMSGALLAADIGLTGVVRGDDRALTRTAGQENTGDTGIISVTVADEQRLTRTCNLCEASHSESSPQPGSPAHSIVAGSTQPQRMVSRTIARRAADQPVIEPRQRLSFGPVIAETPR
jgi:hypothetical protein